MIPETQSQLGLARQCLARAKIILGAGVAEDAGRNAYLAGLHAARAVIFVRQGKVAKTHGGTQTLLSVLARNEPALTPLAVFLSRTYRLKTVADYGSSDASEVSLDAARDAIDEAEALVEQIARLLA